MAVWPTPTAMKKATVSVMRLTGVQLKTALNIVVCAIGYALLAVGLPHLSVRPVLQTHIGTTMESAYATQAGLEICVRIT